MNNCDLTNRKTSWGQSLPSNQGPPFPVSLYLWWTRGGCAGDPPCSPQGSWLSAPCSSACTFIASPSFSFLLLLLLLPYLHLLLFLSPLSSPPPLYLLISFDPSPCLPRHILQSRGSHVKTFSEGNRKINLKSYI